MERRTLEVPPGHNGEAVALILHDGLGVPHSQAKGLIDAGCVSLNGRPVKRYGQRCEGGDVVEIRYDPDRRYAPTPPPRPGHGFRIVHEDREIVVVDKMPGLLSSPAPGEESDSLAERIAESLKARGFKKPQLYVVHRLDRHTSGLLAFAKTPRALESMTAQFESHEAGREYVALVEGRVDQDRGTIQSWLAEDPKTLSVRTTPLRGAGKRAVTHFVVVERFEAATLVRVHLETGRKHQIRIHMAEIGHPVLGDRRYGPGSPLVSRVALHAERLTFRHPRGLEPVTFEAPWPEDFARLVRDLRRGGGHEPSLYGSTRHEGVFPAKSSSGTTVSSGTKVANDERGFAASSEIEGPRTSIQRPEAMRSERRTERRDESFSIRQQGGGSQAPDTWTRPTGGRHGRISVFPAGLTLSEGPAPDGRQRKNRDAGNGIPAPARGAQGDSRVFAQDARVSRDATSRASRTSRGPETDSRHRPARGTDPAKRPYPHSAPAQETHPRLSQAGGSRGSVGRKPDGTSVMRPEGGAGRGREERFESGRRDASPREDLGRDEARLQRLARQRAVGYRPPQAKVRPVGRSAPPAHVEDAKNKPGSWPRAPRQPRTGMSERGGSAGPPERGHSDRPVHHGREHGQAVQGSDRQQDVADGRDRASGHSRNARYGHRPQGPDGAGAEGQRDRRGDRVHEPEHGRSKNFPNPTHARSGGSGSRLAKPERGGTRADVAGDGTTQRGGARAHDAGHGARRLKEARSAEPGSAPDAPRSRKTRMGAHAKGKSFEARKPWEFKEKGMHRRAERRRKIAAARAKGKKR